MIFVLSGGVRGENSDKLDVDYLFNAKAMFLRCQGLENKTKIVSKRSEKRKKNREEAK